MANNEFIDGTLTVGGAFTASGNIGSASAAVTSTLSSLNNGVVTTSTTKALVVTTESLTTAAATLYTCTITNTVATTGDLVFATMTTGGTNTGGNPVIQDATAGSGKVTVRVLNAAQTQSSGTAISGTLKFNVLVLKA